MLLRYQREFPLPDLDKIDNDIEEISHVSTGGLSYIRVNSFLIVTWSPYQLIKLTH